MMPLSERKRSSPLGNKDDPHQVQFCFVWVAINAGDRVESALKDMALVMKQLNRSDEAIEAMKLFRHLCPPDSQESLDNFLVELYKLNDLEARPLSNYLGKLTFMLESSFTCTTDSLGLEELETIYTALLKTNMDAATFWSQQPLTAREYASSTIIPACTVVVEVSNSAKDLIEKEVSTIYRCRDNSLYMLLSSPQKAKVERN